MESERLEKEKQDQIDKKEIEIVGINVKV